MLVLQAQVPELLLANEPLCVVLVPTLALFAELAPPAP